MHTFKEFSGKGMMRSSLIYIPSKDIGLLVGGKACAPYRKLDTIK